MAGRVESPRSLHGRVVESCTVPSGRWCPAQHGPDRWTFAGRPPILCGWKSGSSGGSRLSTTANLFRSAPPQQRAVLGALALAPGQIVAAGSIIDALWADPPATAANLVQGYVSGLRKALSRRARDGLIRTEPPGYRLDLLRPRPMPDGWRCSSTRRVLMVPTLAGRLFTDALALWRGPVLADSDIACRFAPERVAQLDALRRSAREERVDALPRARTTRRGARRARSARHRRPRSRTRLGTADGRSLPVRSPGRRAARLRSGTDVPRRRTRRRTGARAPCHRTRDPRPRTRARSAGSAADSAQPSADLDQLRRPRRRPRTDGRSSSRRRVS